MSLLSAVNYDPTAAVTKSTSSLLAMTAIDTTHLRLGVVVPSSGNVMVRLKTVIHGSTSVPTILLGVLEAGTVKGRGVPIGSVVAASATTMVAVETVFTITGLTAGSHTFDAAYAVQASVGSTGIKYGGPNDALGNDAFGPFVFEIWSA